MKKAIVLLLAAACMLTACAEKPGEEARNKKETLVGSIQSAIGRSEAKEEIITGDFGEPEGYWRMPGHQERTIDELIDALKSGEEPTDGSGTPRSALAARDTSGFEDLEGYAYAGSVEADFPTEPWPEGIEMTELIEEERTGEDGPGALGELSSQSGKDWPQDGLTEGLPVPPGKISFSVVEDGVLTVSVSGIDADAYADYVEAVRAAGFSVNANEEDLSAFAAGMLTYSANHADGRLLVLTLMSGSLMVELS